MVQGVMETPSKEDVLRSDEFVSLDEPMQEYLAAEFHGGGGVSRLGVARSLNFRRR